MSLTSNETARADRPAKMVGHVATAIVTGAAIVACIVGLSGCGGKEMSQLQLDAALEAAGPLTKEERERASEEKSAQLALEKKQVEQEVAEGKATTKRLEEKDHERSGGGGGGGGGH